jgi:hypothetical protein
MNIQKANLRKLQEIELIKNKRLLPGQSATYRGPDVACGPLIE